MQLFVQRYGRPASRNKIICSIKQYISLVIEYHEIVIFENSIGKQLGNKATPLKTFVTHF